MRRRTQSSCSGGSGMPPVPEPPEALEPAEGPLDNVTLSLERNVRGIQLASRLLSFLERDAGSGSDVDAFDQSERER